MVVEDKFEAPKPLKKKRGRKPKEKPVEEKNNENLSRCSIHDGLFGYFSNQPRLSDQKNVLKKISLFVKNLIFSNNNISRTELLNKTFCMDKENLKMSYNLKAKSNLKRRVYDTINVQVSTKIIDKKTVKENGKKEYYYKPIIKMSEIEKDKRDVLTLQIRERLAQIQKKIYSLDNHKIHQEEWNSLINNNKKRALYKITGVGINEALDFREPNKNDQTLNQQIDMSSLKTINSVILDDSNKDIDSGRKILGKRKGKKGYMSNSNLSPNKNFPKPGDVKKTPEKRLKLDEANNFFTKKSEFSVRLPFIVIPLKGAQVIFF